MPRYPLVRDRDVRSRLNRTLRNQELAARMRAATCPEELRDLGNQLAEANLPIADALASRYSDRGIASDDLCQVARLALVRASRAFRPDPDQEFLAYAVPCIRGELRRHFRDAGWVVRPPRRVQEAQHRLRLERPGLNEKLGREATHEELAEALEIDERTVIEALTLHGCFYPESLDRTINPEAGSDSTVGDRLPDVKSDFELCEARLVLEPLLAQLSPRDARILHLRFVRGLTQREVGEAIGVTQVQVSRILNRILACFRDQLAGFSYAELQGQQRGNAA